MPCNTIVRSKVEFLAASTDKNLLAAGLNAMGHTAIITDAGVSFSDGYGRGSYDAATGRLTAPTTFDTEAVKRAYSEQVVKATAKKNGWQVSWTTDAVTGNRKATVLRREF